MPPTISKTATKKTAKRVKKQVKKPAPNKPVTKMSMAKKATQKPVAKEPARKAASTTRKPGTPTKPTRSTKSKKPLASDEPAFIPFARLQGSDDCWVVDAHVPARVTTMPFEAALAVLPAGGSLLRVAGVAARPIDPAAYSPRRGEHFDSRGIEVDGAFVAEHLTLDDLFWLWRFGVLHRSVDKMVAGVVQPVDEGLLVRCRARNRTNFLAHSRLADWSVRFEPRIAPAAEQLSVGNPVEIADAAFAGDPFAVDALLALAVRTLDGGVYGVWKQLRGGVRFAAEWKRARCPVLVRSS